MPSPFDDIFGGSGPQWTREQIVARIRGEADRQQVDPDLAVAVATQESSLIPDNHGDNGKSRGLFHLQEKAAIDAGINPQWRDDPGVNIYGGVRYLKQKLDQSKGNVEQALSRYNRGTPDYQGIGDPNYVNHVLRHYNPEGVLAKQQPTLLERAAKFVQPARAEAATPQQAAPNAIWDDIFGAPPAAPAPKTPAPPTARSTPEQDAAYRAARGQQEPAPVSQAGMSDEERTTQVRQELAAWEQQAGRPWREGDPRMPSEKRLGVPDEKPLEEGITKPSTMIPLLMPGAGAKAGMRILPEAWRWVGRIGGEALTQTAGELTGKAIETGQAPNWQEIATTTAWNLAPQAGEELFRAVPRAILRSGQGARTLLSDVAAQESKGLGRRVFHPQDEQVLSQMFEDVKASGVKLDIDPVTDLFTSLQPSQRQVLLRDIKAISSPLAAALQRTGTPGAPRITGWDIGDLQTMRSELIKRGHAVRTPERQDLINEMRMAVDDAISHGMAVGSTAAGGNPATLKAAQAGWRRLKQSDDLQALVTKHTNYSPNLAYQDLNLAALRKSLDGTNPLGRKVAASLGDTETAALQAELATLAKRYPFVKVPNSIMNIGGKVGLPGAAYLAITGNLPGAAVAASSAVMALALQSPRAMSVFRSAIVNGKGRLSTNDIAAIVNAARQVSDVEESSGTPQ